MKYETVWIIFNVALFSFGGMYAFDIRPDLDLSLSAVTTESVGCGAVYEVASGDTLNEIATRAYGTDNHEAIFEANSETLTSAAKLDVGDELLLPCLNGESPKIGTIATATSPAFSMGSAVAAANDQTMAPGDATIATTVVLVTGSDFAPFVDTALPEGGMTAEMVRLALSNAERERPIEISVVEDWATHPDLIEKRTFDLGFPWYKPDCTRQERLSAPMQRSCAEFAFSEPLFEVAIGYYVRSGDALAAATEYSQLSGQRICRPANHFTFDLELEGLVEPNATLLTPPKASDCLAMLKQGKVDVVTLSKAVASLEITRLGLLDLIAEIPALASGQTLHAVAPKDNPVAVAYLGDINDGLAGLQESGRWYEIVARHLGPYGVVAR